ncbi:MAG: tetratricopeptide repeat protein [Bdellovibrionaceae bacterium]|nr:tetratricopeptide repeat protein [Pseudobdellovibrionaceae bacterium]
MSAIFEDPRPQAALGGPVAYQTGVRQLEQEDWKGALASFQTSLTEQPTSAYTQVTVFNSGRAYEGLGYWSEAEDAYRSVVRATGRAPKLQALALYRLSFCYEVRGDDPRTIAALTDVSARAQFLPDEIASAELPARLAAAYARVGNVDEALKFYSRAEAGVSRLRNQAGAQSVPEWLPRTLYFMGRMSLRAVSWTEFENALRPIARAQLYLLQAVELDAGKWSQEATRELIRIYTEVYDVIHAPPVEDDADAIVERRAAQERQWQLVELTLANLGELRAARPPSETTRSVHIEEVFVFVDGMEKKLLSILDQPLEGVGLTREAKQRREAIRGRTVRPDDSLEKAYEKKSRKKSGQSVAEPPPSAPAPVTPAAGDPNL